MKLVKPDAQNVDGGSWGPDENGGGYGGGKYAEYIPAHTALETGSDLTGR
jgi:hypothetical protein